MPIIKDPVHNQHQGQFGVVYCEHLPGGGDGLAVYDKGLDSSNNVRHLPTGWRVNGPISELDTPYMWCNVPINYEIRINNYNAGPHGPVTEPDEEFLGDLDQWTNRPLTPPRNGNIIYPL
jgi:hypothetical protein